MQRRLNFLWPSVLGIAVLEIYKLATGEFGLTDVALVLLAAVIILFNLEFEALAEKINDLEFAVAGQAEDINSLRGEVHFLENAVSEFWEDIEDSSDGVAGGKGHN